MSESLTVKQLRAARALLGWSQSDLARATSVSEPTLARLEAADGELGGRASTANVIRSTLEAAGIEFLDDPLQAGVRIKFESTVEKAFYRDATTLFPGSKAWKRTTGPDWGADFVGVDADGGTIFVEVKAAHVDPGVVAQQLARVRKNHPDARVAAILMGGPPSSDSIDGVEIYQVPFVGKWDALPRMSSDAGAHEFRKGDNVRLRRGSVLWKNHATLRKAIGRVAELIDDGTSIQRISVSYPDGEAFEGEVAGLFEYVPPD